jgi:hypothetical protein
VLLPQIIHNAYQGVKPTTNLSYFTVLMANQIYILYYRGIPHNVMRKSPNYMVCAGVCWSLALQLLIVSLQNKCGSRFFVPRRCIPNYYNYYIDVESSGLNVKLLGEDCAICLFPLGEEPGDAINREMHDICEKKIKKIIMKTPCNHMFHVCCL